MSTREEPGRCHVEWYEAWLCPMAGRGMGRWQGQPAMGLQCGGRRGGGGGEMPRVWGVWEGCWDFLSPASMPLPPSSHGLPTMQCRPGVMSGDGFVVTVRPVPVGGG